MPVYSMTGYASARTGASPAGEQAVPGEETRDAEDLDGFVLKERRQRGRGNARFAERQGGETHGLPVLVAQRAVGADELANTVSARCGWGLTGHGWAPTKGRRRGAPLAQACRHGGIGDSATNGGEGWTGDAARTGGERWVGSG